MMNSVRATDVAPIILVMGPAGAGKSEIGAAVARELGIGFLDADSLHSPAARAKMAGGVSLTDEDRVPWLERIADLLKGASVAATGLVVACSALKRSYRDTLRRDAPQLFVVELQVPLDILTDRVRSRSSHFFPVDLLPAQLAALEPLQADERGMQIDGVAAPGTIVDTVVARVAAIGLD